MRFSYSSLTIGRRSLLFLADSDAADSPKSADGTYASSESRSSCNATCRACAIRSGFRTRACASVSTLSHRSALPRQRPGVGRLSIWPVKHGFLRTSRILPKANKTFVTEHFRQPRNRNAYYRFDIFNMCRATGTTRPYGSVFPARKKGPDLRRGLSLSRKIISMHQNIPIRT
jgi:hypothetical protein